MRTIVAQCDARDCVHVADQGVLNFSLAQVKASYRVVNASEEDNVVALGEGDTCDLVADCEARRERALSEVPQLDRPIVAATGQHIALEARLGVLVRDVKRIDDVFVALEAP